MPSLKLRSSDTCFKLIEISPGTEHLEITGCRLPTYEQVLLSYTSNMNKLRSEDASNKQKLKGVVSNIVAQQVLRHYQKAGIASKPLKVIKDDVQKVQIEYEQINKKKNPTRISEFRQKLRKTIPFWKKNTINHMKSSLSSSIPLADKQMIKTDIEFLQSMMSDRLATYASMDLSNSVRKEKRYARQEQEETRIAQEAERQGSSIMSTVLQDSGSDTNGDDVDDVNNMFKTPPTKKPHKRTVKTGTTIALPHDFLKSPTLVSALVRNKITPTAAGAIFHALIEDNNGNASAVNLSYTQIYRYNLSVPAINKDILADKKLQIIAMCKELLKEKFVRCDYKEIFLALV